MQWDMLKQVAVAQESIKATYDESARHLPPKSRLESLLLKRGGPWRNIFEVLPTYSSMIRAIVDGKMVVRTHTGSFDTVDDEKAPKTHLGHTATEWEQKFAHVEGQYIKAGTAGNDFPAEGGLRPPRGVIEDLVSYHGYFAGEAVSIDWDDVYNSINDPYYYGEM